MKMFPFFVILTIACLLNVYADVNFNELFDFQPEALTVHKTWFEDYDNDGEDEFLIHYKYTNNIHVYEINGELVDSFYQNPNLYYFSFSNIDYQLDWINEYNPVNYDANLKIYLREIQSQTILDSLSILYNSGTNSNTLFTVENVKFVSSDFGERILVTGKNHHFDYGLDNETNIDHIYVIAFESESLTHLDTVENYGSTLLINNTQPELVSHGYNETINHDMEGWAKDLTVHFGKYNIETQTLTEIFQYSGSEYVYLGNYSYSHFPTFIMLTNNDDFQEYGSVFSFKSRNTNTELIDQVIRMDQTLTDTLWTQEDLFLQTTGWIYTGARLGNVLGNDKLILFGMTPNSQSNLEIVDLNNGYSLHNQQTNIESYRITNFVKNSIGKFHFVTLQYQLGKLYEMDISSFVVTEESIIQSVLSQISNYPNPFNPSTTIEFSIQNDSKIDLMILNIKGQNVKTLTNEFLNAGDHSILWNGVDDFGNLVSSGLYLIKLNINGKTEAVKKCLMLK